MTWTRVTSCKHSPGQNFKSTLRDIALQQKRNSQIFRSLIIKDLDILGPLVDSPKRRVKLDSRHRRHKVFLLCFCVRQSPLTKCSTSWCLGQLPWSRRPIVPGPQADHVLNEGKSVTCGIVGTANVHGLFSFSTALSSWLGL